MTSVREAAREIIEDPKYVENWFGASSFFNTVYTSEVYTGDYFITCDHFMSQNIWAVRKIEPEGITTVCKCDSKQEAFEALKRDRKCSY